MENSVVGFVCNLTTVLLCFVLAFVPITHIESVWNVGVLVDGTQLLIYDVQIAFFPYEIISTNCKAATSKAALMLKANLWKHILIFWFLFLFFLITSSIVLGCLSYACDPNKNVPTITKYTFVPVFKTADRVANETASDYRDAMRDNFKLGDVKVWPYYLAFGFSITCIIFSSFGWFVASIGGARPHSGHRYTKGKNTFPATSDSLHHRRHSSNSQCCDICDTTHCVFCYSGGGNSCCNDCSGCCDRCCSCPNCDCFDCNCDCFNCNCGDENYAVALIVVVVIIVAAALLGLIFLFILGLAHSRTLFVRYREKKHDLYSSHTGAEVVADLEGPADF